MKRIRLARLAFTVILLIGTMAHIKAEVPKNVDLMSIRSHVEGIEKVWYMFNETINLPSCNDDHINEVNSTTDKHFKAPSCRAVFEEIESDQVNADVISRYRDGSDNPIGDLEAISSAVKVTEEKLYPEYYLTIEEKENLRYCPNYYDWNTVMYYEDLATPPNEFVVRDYVSAEVLFPTEHVHESLAYVQGLVNISTAPYKVLPQNVFFDRTHKIFYLKIGDYYYRKWDNSYLWQNSKGIRDDTVYASITPGVQINATTYRINHWIYIDGNVTPLTKDGELNTVTNFRNAILLCLAANNGNMKLHGDKIYGITGAGITINYSNFIIDGQGATICYIPRNRKAPQQKANTNTKISGAIIEVSTNNSLFTIKNIKIKGLRTAIRNSASGIPFSHSSTNMYGIACRQCKDFHLKDVEFSGMGYDMALLVQNSKTGTTDRALIEGWRSKASEGIWLTKVPNLTIINSDVTMAPYSSKHTIYCGDSRWVKNHVIKNSRIVQNTKYNSNFLQYKTTGVTTSMEDDIHPKVGNLTFENCYIKTGRGTMLNTTYNPFNLTFDNCTILQHHDLAADGSIGFWGTSKSAQSSVFGSKASTWGLIGCNSWCNLTIKNCRIKAWGMVLYIHNNGDSGFGTNPYISDPIVRIEDTIITILDLPNYSKYVPKSDVNKIIKFDTKNYFGSKKLIKIYKNIVTNADGMYSKM